MKHFFKVLSTTLIFHCLVGVVIGQNTYPYPSTGNIGIGTVSPQERLQVVGSLKINAVSTLEIAYTKISWNRPIGSGATVFDNHRDAGNVGFIFNTTTGAVGSPFTELMRLNANGNVGIGTSAPVSRLHVVGNIASTSDAVLTGFVQLWNDNAIIWKAGNSAAGSKLRFGSATDLGATNWSEKMCITDAGNVGINTATPTSKLEVQGSGGGILAINCRATDATTTARLSLINPTQNWAISNYINVGFGISDEVAGAARLIINSSGNVGIGTTTPGAYKLAVNGDIKCKKVKVTQSEWPDYVFDTAYNLTPLDKIQDFITQNKHLPDVPSAAIVAKDGLDLGDNQAVLLRKIEELTLYLIEMNKIIEKQSLAAQKQALEMTALYDSVRTLSLAIEKNKSLDH